MPPSPRILERVLPRTSVRAALAALVAVTLLIGLPSGGTASASGRSAEARSIRLAPFSPARARAVLARVTREVHAAAAYRRAPGTVLPRRDLTLALRDLDRAIPSLDRADQARAAALINPPLTVPPPRANCVADFTYQVLQSTHFCLHYTSSTDPAFAQTTLNTLEDVWKYEIGTLGFRPPPPDADGIFDVFMKDIGGGGYYGACAPNQNTVHSTSSCILDDDFSTAQFGAPPLNSLRVTAAHEFFHAIQFGYDAGDQTWFLEGTAVWMEDQAYPQINDYLQYLPFSAIVKPGSPVDYAGTLERYGAVLFWKYLSESAHDPGVIRRVWESADAYVGTRNGLQAAAAVLASEGHAFGPSFATFAAWNTEPPGPGYVDARLYPAPTYQNVIGLTRSRPGTGPLAVSLDHLSSAAFLLRPGTRLPQSVRLRVSVDGPARSTMPQALVQIRLRAGGVLYRRVTLDSEGNGTLGFGFGPGTVRSVVLTLSNASLHGDDAQPFVMRARLRF